MVLLLLIHSLMSPPPSLDCGGSLSGPCLVIYYLDVLSSFAIILARKREHNALLYCFGILVHSSWSQWAQIFSWITMLITFIVYMIDKMVNLNWRVTTTRYFSPFFIISRKTRKKYFLSILKISKFFLAITNKVCLKIANSGGFAMFLLLKVRTTWF